MAAARALAASAVGRGGNAGAPEKSTKKAQPVLCFAVSVTVTGSAAAAAAMEWTLEATELLLVAASKPIKKA